MVQTLIKSKWELLNKMSFNVSNTLKIGLSNIGSQIWIDKYGLTNEDCQIWIDKYGLTNMD